MAKAAAGKKVDSKIKVLVRQVRSSIGRDPSTVRTLCALGLGRIGNKQEMTVNKSVLGMLRRVEHLVRIDEMVN